MREVVDNVSLDELITQGTDVVYRNFMVRAKKARQMVGMALGAVLPGFETATRKDERLKTIREMYADVLAEVEGDKLDELKARAHAEASLDERLKFADAYRQELRRVQTRRIESMEHGRYDGRHIYGFNEACDMAVSVLTEMLEDKTPEEIENDLGDAAPAEVSDE